MAFRIGKHSRDVAAELAQLRVWADGAAADNRRMYTENAELQRQLALVRTHNLELAKHLDAADAQLATQAVAQRDIERVVAALQAQATVIAAPSEWEPVGWEELLAPLRSLSITSPATNPRGFVAPTVTHGRSPVGASKFVVGRSRTPLSEYSFGVIDFETTGLSPDKGDRVIEVAVARLSADGTVEDEYASVINPDGRDTGAVFIHGISNDHAWSAPLFREIVGEILQRLSGTILVAHNASFEMRFLAKELAIAGVSIPQIPVLDTVDLARRTLSAHNYQLTTLMEKYKYPHPDAHAALGDVRALTFLLPLMLEQLNEPFLLGVEPQILPVVPVQRRPMTRAFRIKKGTDGWMSSLISRLPLSSIEVAGDDANAYLSALATVLEDEQLHGDEAKMLAKLAGRAGMGQRQITMLNERFLESMREAAMADLVLTPLELREMNAAAIALGRPSYFDDLVPSDGLTPLAVIPNQRRCGHCRKPGHSRTKCPDL